MDGLGVVEDPFFPQPGLGDVPAALGARGDEVELVSGGHETLEDSGAILVDLELGEESAVVEAHPELVALLGGHAVQAGNDGVVARAGLLLREEVPSDLALVGKLHVEFLREAAKVRH